MGLFELEPTGWTSGMEILDPVRRPFDETFDEIFPLLFMLGVLVLRFEISV
jgi:hypothetical protein